MAIIIMEDQPLFPSRRLAKEERRFPLKQVRLIVMDGALEEEGAGTTTINMLPAATPFRYNNLRANTLL